MNKNYNRISIEDTQGNTSYKGVYDPTREDVEITKKKPELTPKQKAFLRELNRKNGEAKEVFEHGLGGFINMYYVKNSVLYENTNLKTVNICRVLYLATYIDWNTGQENLLVKPGQFKINYPMTKNEMQALLGLTKNPFYEFLNDVKNNGLMYEVEGKFYMNPDYFNKGKANKEKEYTRLYINTVRNLYAQCKPRQHKQLSYLFKLIPKTHYLTNIIVHNPEEKDSLKLKYMDMIDICNFLNVNNTGNNSSKLKKELINLVLDDGFTKSSTFKQIIAKGAEFEGETSYYVLNPKIFYAGDDFEVASEILRVCFFKEHEIQ